MEKKEHLAIASVPIQEWNEVYDEEQAFSFGTVFPELNRQFFVTVMDGKSPECEKQMNAQQTKLLQIQKVGFVVDDLRLYLDTHPDEKTALRLYKEMLGKRRTLMREFATQYYPLTESCMDLEADCYCWPEGKIPWEGACV